MPTTIDLENAKQIRQPMAIRIEFDASNPEIELKASNAGIAPKLFNYSDITQEWAMRPLADLQGDGFLLTGESQLYDSSVIDSNETGKIGVRGNIGDVVAIRIAPVTAVNSVVIQATGDHMEYNGSSYELTGESININISGDSTPVFTFYPISSTTRVEVQNITYGLDMSFSNDSIIDVELNLRADLQPIDPSLPESEIEVRVFYPDDISAALAGIADERPITYSAGYADDMCETRKFYISEPPEWDNKTITFKAVDSVHLLDKETFPFFVGGISNDSSYSGQSGYYYSDAKHAFRRLNMILLDQLYMGGIQLAHQDRTFPANIDGTINSSSKYNQNSIIKRQMQRDVIANLMNLCHWVFADYDIPTGYYSVDAFWPVFVDAGIPSASWRLPSVKWDIYENDCGNIIRKTDRKIKNISILSGTIDATWTSSSVWNLKNDYLDATVEIIKDIGAKTEYPEFCRSLLGVWEYDDPYVYDNYSMNADQILPIDFGIHPYISSSVKYGEALLDNGIEQNNNLHVVNKIQGTRRSVFRGLRTWDSAQQSLWNKLKSNGYLDNDSTVASSTRAVGDSFYLTESKRTITTDAALGIDVNAEKTSWFGIMKAGNLAGTASTELLPDLGLKQIAKRSGETGSFTWKGDPRMQPRDFFNFHRLDGTVEVCTIETISLKHEKGGTQAQITYRKGMV